MSQVDQQPELQPSRFKVILHLGAMLVGELADRLQFQNDLLVADEVRFVTSPGADSPLSSKAKACCAT